MSKNSDYSEVRQVLQTPWLKTHIRSRLHALKLSSFLSEEDIVQHSVMCLFETLQSGKQVNHPVAWAKLVSERYISKLYKKHRVSEATELEKIEYFANQNCDKNNSYDIHEEIAKNIQQIKTKNRAILRMRFFQKFSWKKIAEILSHQEGTQICVATARKRGERAVKELRQVFLNKLAS
ncbi:MAG: sigma-70 family RNA polymerase sigma factor [Mastigocoleus sp.]